MLLISTYVALSSIERLVCRRVRAPIGSLSGEEMTCNYYEFDSGLAGFVAAVPLCSSTAPQVKDGVSASARFANILRVD